MNQQRIVLAMSGGVDSSVAAALLVQQGYDVVGVFMRHGEESPVACDPKQLPILASGERLDHKQGCCSATDAEDARRVADQLGIPFYAVNLRAEFGRIMDYFVDEYIQGRTPNPCVMCNNWLKFGKLFDYADSVGAHFVATGHYARLQDPDQSAQSTTAPTMLRGIDHHKDQSYVLFGIPRARLSRMMLPIGGYHKSEIRELAGSLGLRVADKPDSQEICFVTSGHHADFVATRRNADTSGQILTTDGRIVGQHSGIEAFTVGQRKGLGIAMGEPYFVVRIEPDSKQVVIGRKSELACSALTANQLNWLQEPTGTTFRCLAQIRYNSAAQPAIAQLEDDDCLRVEFEEPCFGVAPGQAVVLYEGERVLGGGWIRQSLAV